MQWSSQRDAYIGQWSDGRQFEVDGSCWSEDVQDSIDAIQRECPEKSLEEARAEAEAEMLNPLAWTEDMHGVSVV